MLVTAMDPQLRTGSSVVPRGEGSRSARRAAPEPDSRRPPWQTPTSTASTLARHVGDTPSRPLDERRRVALFPQPLKQPPGRWRKLLAGGISGDQDDPAGTVALSHPERLRDTVHGAGREELADQDAHRLVGDASLVKLARAHGYVGSSYCMVGPISRRSSSSDFSRRRFGSRCVGASGGGDDLRP